MIKTIQIGRKVSTEANSWEILKQEIKNSCFVKDFRSDFDSITFECEDEDLLIVGFGIGKYNVVVKEVN